MIMPFHINTDQVTDAFSSTKALLIGHEPIIFDSMHLVLPSFTLPINDAQFDSKFLEIDRILSRRAMTGGIDMFFKLIDNILFKIIQENTPIDLASLVGYWNFDIQERCNIFLTESGHWLYKNSVFVNHMHHTFTHDHIITLIDPTHGIVVPQYILEYFHTALNCFNQYQYLACLALNSIIVEGTLKDVLITRGYQFTNRRNSRYISGLGAALINARNVELFLTPADLPEDLDAVIKPIRNNLVHLSGDALETRLPYLDSHNGIAEFTLKDFIKDPVLIHDLLQGVSYCIENIYTNLRNEGHLII